MKRKVFLKSLTSFTELDYTTQTSPLKNVQVQQ